MTSSDSIKPSDQISTDSPQLDKISNQPDSTSWRGREITPLQKVEDSHPLAEQSMQTEGVGQDQLVKPKEEFSKEQGEVSKKLTPILQKVENTQQLEVNFKKSTQEHSVEISTVSKKLRGMRYEDLFAPGKMLLRQIIFQENLRYAAYMYGGARRKHEGAEHGMQISLDLSDNQVLYWNYKEISAENQKKLMDILNGIIKMGFKIDNLGNFYHIETGTILNLVYDLEKRELNVCFMGIGNSRLLNIPKSQQILLDITVTKSGLSNVLGTIPKATLEAMEIGRLIKNITKDANITPVMIGHSHGGMLAQAAAISNGLKGVIFNSEPLGIGIKNLIDLNIGKKNRKNNADQVIAFSTRGDWLTDGSINAVCRLGRDVGLPVPTVMGKGYQLPTVEGGSKEKHVDILGAINKLNSPIKS